MVLSHEQDIIVRYLLKKQNFGNQWTSMVLRQIFSLKIYFRTIR